MIRGKSSAIYESPGHFSRYYWSLTIRLAVFSPCDDTTHLATLEERRSGEPRLPRRTRNVVSSARPASCPLPRVRLSLGAIQKRNVLRSVSRLCWQTCHSSDATSIIEATPRELWIGNVLTSSHATDEYFNVDAKCQRVTFAHNTHTHALRHTYI